MFVYILQQCQFSLQFVNNKSSEIKVARYKMLITKDNVMRSLQGWIFVVGLMALGNTVSCYVDHSFLKSRLYTGAPEKANDLAGRLFGLWTLMSALLRLSCAILITNRALFNLTLLSFVVAFVHFLSEAFIYNTAPITVGVLAPLVVSGVSMLWMTVAAYYCMSADKRTNDASKENFPRRVEDIPLMRGKRHKAE